MKELLFALVLMSVALLSSSLAIQSAEVAEEDMAVSDKVAHGDEVAEAKLDNVAAADMEELKSKYAALLDNMAASSKKHPFGWGLRRYRYDHPFGYNRFRPGDANMKYKDHPFGFSITRNSRYGDHPFGFGSRSPYGGRKRGEFAPASNTKAFHGKKDLSAKSQEEEEQNTSLFHGKRSENNLLSEWLSDKVLQDELRE